MGFDQRDPEFSDQVVVITGGSRGIGFATARRFLERGARVGICALDPERLAEAARALNALGKVEAVVIDVQSMEQIQRFVSRVHRRFGQLNIGSTMPPGPGSAGLLIRPWRASTRSSR